MHPKLESSPNKQTKAIENENKRVQAGSVQKQTYGKGEPLLYSSVTTPTE